MTALISSDAAAQTRQYIRFYKANKLEQTSRIMFVDRKGRKPGCHNLPTKRRVYQANQIGFAYCTLYAKNNCAADSLIEVKREKDETPVTELTQGLSWFPISEDVRGKKVKSWNCKAPD